MIEKRILCYGDSNTWGYIPASGQRYPYAVRWTGVMADALPEEYVVLEDGLNGRTTAFDDEFIPFINGEKGLGYALVSQKPLDLLIISLGTNDLRFTDAEGSAKALDGLLRLVRNANDPYFARECPTFRNDPAILVISPIHMESEHENYEESFRFAELFSKVAERNHAVFLDAARYAEPSSLDGIHMEIKDHAALGKAVAEKVVEILRRA